MMIIAHRSVIAGIDPLYKAYLEYGADVLMTTLPSIAKQQDYNNRIKTVRNKVGIGNIAELWLPGGGGGEALALLNIMHPGTRSLSKVGSPTYVENDGINATSIENYFDSGFIPNSHGGTVFSVNSASAFFCITNNHGNAAYCFGHRGSGSPVEDQVATRMIPRGGSDQYAISLNNAAGGELAGGTVTNSIGFHLGNRTASNALEYRHNEVQKLNGTTAATVRSNQTIPVGVWKIGAGNIQENTTHRFSIFGFGAGMNATQSFYLNLAFNTTI